jgi:chaperonin GroEL
MLKGAETLYKAVSSTMGPSGHSVIIDNGTTAPLITKDGVTVAKAINLKDKLPGLGAELLKEIAGKTNELAGDGTTTATVLGYGLFSQGVKMIATGRSSIAIKRGIDKATEFAIQELKKNAVKVRNHQDVVNVGTISANGDKKIGELIAEAISKVGEHGIITIEPAKSVTTSLEVVEGMQFDSGYVSPYFVTNGEKLTCELIEPYVLITNKKITQLKDIIGILEFLAKQNKAVLIIGDEIEGEVLQTLLINKMKGVVFSCAVKAPGYGDNRTDILQDIALVTGGTVIDSSSGMALQNVTVDQLGTCSKVIVGRGTTTIVGNGSDEDLQSKISKRVAELQTVLSTNTLDDLRRNQIKKRLAKLSGGVAVVKVGGSTEVEIFEKKDRVEDALNATVAAVQEGILPGGGTALFMVAKSLEAFIEEQQKQKVHEDEIAGMRVVQEACKLPLRVIVENTGKSADIVASNLEQYSSYERGCTCKKCAPLTVQDEECVKGKPRPKVEYGYDAYRHQYCDLVEAGIIDPLKVERYALEHAASVVGLILTSNAVVVNVPDKDVGSDE